MKKLMFLALFAVAGWYGWSHRETLLHPAPTDEAVVVNATDMAIVRVRVTVDGQTMVREVIEPGESAALPFHLAHDSDFQVEWQWKRREGKVQWRGGLVTAGAAASRTTLTAYTDGTVTVTSSLLGQAPGR
jgi:hypothetical protein